MSSEAREFEFNKTWFVEGDFPTLKFMVAYYLGSRDFFGGRVFSVLHKIEWWCDELILTLVIFWRKKQIVKMKNKIACFRYKNVTSVLTCYLVPKYLVIMYTSYLSYKCTLKPRYSEQVCQILFVHYIE